MPEHQLLAGFVFSLVGLSVLFFGYRFFKLALGIMGFAAGFVLLISLGSAMVELGRTELLVAGVIGGIAGVFLFVMAYYAGIFIMGACLGYIIGSSIAPYLAVDPLIPITVAIVLGGMIIFAVQKVVIVCISSFFGAWMLFLGIAQILGRIDTNRLIIDPSRGLLLFQGINWMMLVWLLISLLGIYSQYRGMEKKGAKGRF